MPTFEISEKSQTGALSFDLIDILTVIEPSAIGPYGI
jgi:hypothetical protein